MPARGFVEACVCGRWAAAATAIEVAAVAAVAVVAAGAAMAVVAATRYGATRFWKGVAQMPRKLRTRRRLATETCEGPA